ncbi:hypothetical protein cypCar_00010966 [Cyprinus carpio]|nr:hypothetical protein cypCar_00010966 [Cyprinus carpio]
MAAFRCRRDPCGFICLILTYFSVFYADYVVIQYVLIPAYSESNVIWLYGALSMDLCLILFYYYCWLAIQKQCSLILVSALT